MITRRNGSHAARRVRWPRLVVALCVLATLIVVVATNPTGGSSKLSDRVATSADEVPAPVLIDPFDGDYAVSASTPASLVVTDGSGTVQGLDPGRSLTVSLPAVALADVQVSHDLVLPMVTADSTGLYESTQMRRQPDGDYYAATVVVHADGSLALKAERVSGAVQSTISRVPLPGRLAAGQTLHIESRVVGSDPVTLLARAWTSQTAPDWQLVVTDAGSAAIVKPGEVALRGYLSRVGKLASFKVSRWKVFKVSASASSDPVSPPVTASQQAQAPQVTASTADAPSTSSTGSATVTSSDPPSASAAASDAASASPSSANPSPSSTPPDLTDSSSGPSSTSSSSTSSPSSPSPTSSASSAPASSPAPNAAGFVHPGIVNSSAQLALVRANIKAGTQPSASAFAKAKNSRYGQLSWQPHPRALVGCGAHSSPDEGCTDETDDAQAAYTDALVWSYTGDQAYASKSLDILDAWSAVLKGHKFDTTTYVNGKLQAAWAAETFTKAAEIMRYSHSGWSSAGIARFEDMLTTAFLPLVVTGWTGGGANWQLSMAEATMNIGVFTNDRAVFDAGVEAWRKQVRAAIYLSSDGSAPILPAGTTVSAAKIDAYWYGPTRYVDGLEGEDCRDLTHATMGFAAALNAAETASIQGVDLYGEQKTRLVAGMEYTTRFLNDPSASGWACPKPPVVSGAGATASWEIGYHHFATVDGESLPQTRRWILAHRPTATAQHMNWETLTHGSLLTP